MTTAVDKRFFYLMLSVPHGQEYAKVMGFSSPSKDVSDIELQDVYSRWGVFTLEGIHEAITTTTDWFIEFLNHSEPERKVSEALHSMVVSYSMALVNHLLDTQHITILLHNTYEDLADD